MRAKRRNGNSNGKRFKKSDGTKALKKVNLLMKAIETKHFDFGIPLINDTNWDGNIRTINEVSQGSSDTNRDGDKIYMKSLSWRFDYSISDLANVFSNRIRTIIIHDKLNTITTVPNFLLQTGTTRAPEALFNYDRRLQYQVLYDRTIVFNINSSSKNVSVKKTIKLNKVVQFNAGTTTIQKGALKLIFISNVDTGGISQDKPNIEGAIRILFLDN